MHFSWDEGGAIEACMEGVGVASGAQMEAKGKPYLALEAQLKRLSVCVCVHEELNHEAFH